MYIHIMYRNSIRGPCDITLSMLPDVYPEVVYVGVVLLERRGPGQGHVPTRYPRAVVYMRSVRK